MSTITTKRRAIQRSINWGRYREQRGHLADLFAVIAYSGQPKRPLALGIKADLIGANVGLSTDEIKHFLRAYTYGPRYLRVLQEGARRWRLDSFPDGYVTREEADYAALCLRTHYADREWHRRLRAANLVPAEDMDWAYPLDEVQPVGRAA